MQKIKLNAGFRFAGKAYKKGVQELPEDAAKCAMSTGLVTKAKTDAPKNK